MTAPPDILLLLADATLDATTGAGMSGRFPSPISHLESAPSRFLRLPAEPESALMKAVETMDHDLPRWALVVAAGSGAPFVQLPRAVNNRSAVGSGPIDPTGPPRVELPLPAARLVERLSRQGIAAGIPEDPPEAAPNGLAYALARYVALRGAETWFRRRPPAGLHARIGVVLLPVDFAAAERGRALATIVEALADEP